jgi:hypothetical protein
LRRFRAETTVQVTFFLAGETDLERLRRVDPDDDRSEFMHGERAWILQTYLRLAAAGHPVELTGGAPERGLVIYHAKQVESLLRHWRRWNDCILVGVRADHSESHLADFEVVQNRVWEDGVSRFFVPFWPQPGLLPRDPSRGERIERVAFKGFTGNLHPDFAGPAMVEALRQRRIELVIDAVDYRGAATATQSLTWADYSDIDLVLAVRRPGGTHTDKPASKLYNAWRAGAPALLGPEPAFRELRTHPLDYLEVASVAEALAAIDRLRAAPALYRAMVERGRERGAEFSPEAIRERWVDLLWHRIPALAAARPWRSVPSWLRPAVRKANRLLHGRPAR